MAAYKLILAILLFAHLTLNYALAKSNNAKKKKQNVIFILVDGFANYYLDSIHNLAGFQTIEKFGVRADSLMPEWPSISYPNHYTMMTGRVTVFS